MLRRTSEGKGPEKKYPIIIQKRITDRKKKQWNPEKFEGRPFLTEAFGIAVVDMQLDMETFKPHIRELSMLIDGGKICNREAAENGIKIAVHKILSGIIEGEEDKPDRISIEFMESDKRSSQIGELPYQILPSAITQAISQIAGEPVTEFPLQVDTIYKIMHRKNVELETESKTHGIKKALDETEGLH